MIGTAKTLREIVGTAVAPLTTSFGSDLLLHVSEYLAEVANEAELSPCERACYAMCAAKMWLKYAPSPVSMLAPASTVISRGTGVCYEYATLTKAFSDYLGIKSVIEEGAANIGSTGIGW